MLFTWWVWMAAAMILAILETLAPVFIFLGLAVGAATIGLLLAIGVTFGGSVGWLFVAFACTSVAVTVMLRLALGGAAKETKTFRDDINRG